MKRILLVGLPNSGKSTLFNALTGEERAVANYTGTSVDVGLGRVLGHDIELVDLPGIYGPNPASEDEGVTCIFLNGAKTSLGHYHDVILVIDATRLYRSLVLYLLLRRVMGRSPLVVITKGDLAPSIDWKSLWASFHLSYRMKNDADLALYIEMKSSSEVACFPHTLDEFDADSFLMEARALVQKSSHPSSLPSPMTARLDKILMHPLWGGILFVGIFYVLFLALFVWLAPLGDGIEAGVGMVGPWIRQTISSPFLSGLLADGVVAGVGAVVVFVPQIFFLFFFLSLLDQSGYVARAAMIVDKPMSWFGLSGRAFLPYMAGLGCSVPAMMATRTLTTRSERMAVLMTIPFMSCSGRLPAFVLLVGTIIPSITVFRVFNLQALVFLGVFFGGALVALLMAKIFRMTWFKGMGDSFFMELPLYQRPRMRLAMKEAFVNSKSFLRKAGTYILAFSILFWLASSYPRLESGRAPDLEHSYVGQFGKTLEPALHPVGFDWKIGVALVTSFGARELFVSSLSTFYSVAEHPEESVSLRQGLLRDYGLPTMGAVLVFFALACQCVSTFAVARKETGHTGWALFLFLYTFVLAYLGAFITRQVLL